MLRPQTNWKQSLLGKDFVKKKAFLKTALSVLKMMMTVFKEKRE